MKNLMKYSLLLGLIAMLILSGCKKDEPEPTPTPPAANKFEIFKQYLMDNNLDTPDVLDGWITSATAVYDNIMDGDDANDFYVIDIRSEDDFVNGHIPGAVNATLGGILDAAALSGGKPIIVACYTGQTAGHAVMALRLSGYANAKVLKWGMCSWNPATSQSWPGNIGNVAVGNSNWKFPAAPATLVEFGEPTLESTAETGEEILAERVAALLAGGFGKISNADVLASPANYFINNYWSEEDNAHYGHIVDAYRILPLSLAGGEYKYLNQAATIVTYCWTGQTSSMMTAYLTVLGYDAKSLLFGANGMIYENLESHKFSDSETMDYPLENSLPSHDGFPELKDYLVSNGMDISVVVDAWITTATVVYDNIIDGDDTNDFYVIDIRSADDFAAGHIQGAVNSTLANVLTTAEGANGKPIIIACYTGQTAGHAVVALRLSGYANAKVLKWGMSGWNPTTSGPWSSNTGDVAIGHANWSMPASIISNIEYGDPSFETTAETPAAVLEERVQILLAGGLNKVSNTEVLTNNSSYFINNFWSQEDVEHYGHISGAFRVQPLTLANDEYKYLNPDYPVVTYCWTGQTSSMITAYLKVLGYDSKSLLFGTNGMIYSNLESHQFAEGAIMDYPLVSK